MVVAELQHGLFRLEPVGIVLHVLGGHAPECAVKPFLEPVVQGFDVLDVVDFPLNMPVEVRPDYHMLDVGVHGVALIVVVSVRTQHLPLGSGVCRLFANSAFVSLP